MIGHDIHPSGTAGDGKRIPRRTTYAPGDREVEIVRCAQCGMFCREGIDSEGESQDSPGITQSGPTYEASDLTQAPNGTSLIYNPLFENYRPSDNPHSLAIGSNTDIYDGWDFILNGSAPCAATVLKILHPTIIEPARCLITATDTTNAVSIQVQQRISLAGASGLNYAAARRRQLQFSCVIEGGIVGTVSCSLAVTPSDPQEAVTSSFNTDNFSSFYETLTTPILNVIGTPTALTATIQLDLPAGILFRMATAQILDNGAVIAAYDTSQNAGCRFCGSLNWRGMGRAQDPFSRIRQSMENR